MHKVLRPKTVGAVRRKLIMPTEDLRTFDCELNPFCLAEWVLLLTFLELKSLT